MPTDEQRRLNLAAQAAWGKISPQSTVEPPSWVFAAVEAALKTPDVTAPSRAAVSGTKKPMRCFYCSESIVGTIQQAKRHGWKLWVGGAVCQREECREAHVRAPWAEARAGKERT